MHQCLHRYTLKGLLLFFLQGHLLLFRKIAEGEPQERASAQIQHCSAPFHLTSVQSQGTLPRGFSSRALLLHVRDSIRMQGGSKEIGKQAEEDMVAQNTNPQEMRLCQLCCCWNSVLPIYLGYCATRGVRENRQHDYCSLCHTSLFSYYSVVYCSFSPVCLILYYIKYIPLYLPRSLLDFFEINMIPRQQRHFLSQLEPDVSQPFLYLRRI